MVDAQTEAEWRAEFELIGEAQVSVLVCDGIIPEPKRQLSLIHIYFLQ